MLSSGSPGKLLEENARLAQKMAQDVEAARKEAEVQREDARQAREAPVREQQESQTLIHNLFILYMHMGIEYEYTLYTIYIYIYIVFSNTVLLY